MPLRSRSFPSPIAHAVLAAFLAVTLLLVAPGDSQGGPVSLPPQPEPAVAPPPSPVEEPELRPVLLLLHGGGFFRGHPGYMDYAARIAAADRAFATLQPAYPLNSLPGAFTSIRDLALSLRARGRAVYAYGDSAGGGIASWLAARGLVRAAASKAPPTAMLDWRTPFARHYELAPAGDPHSWRYLKAGPRTLRSYSAAYRPSRSPQRIFHSCGDAIVPCSMNLRYARRDPLVSLAFVRGAHKDTATKRQAFARGLRWLKARAFG